MKISGTIAPAFAGILIAAALLSAPGCSSTRPELSSGIDLAGMDKSVAPGDDVNAYANGGWSKATPIPADKPSYGIGAELADKTRNQTRAIIEDSAKSSSPANSDSRKLGDYYSTFMDESAIDSKGPMPLKPQFNEIDAIADRRDLARVIGSRLRADVDPLNNTNFETGNLFGVWITQDLNDAAHTCPYLLQGGLGMPDRDYYLSASPHMAELRKQYQKHTAAMFQLAGFSDPDARAARVFALETAIAEVHATRVQSEDVHSAVPWNREDLPTKAPGLDWPALLEAASLKDAPVFIVWQPRAVAGLSTLTAKQPLDTWKDWLRLHTIEQSAGFLPKAFVDERFNFYGKTLSGVQQLRPRWQRGIDFTNIAFGDAVGKLYVERYFPADTKAKAQAMVNDLIKAFAKRIDSLTWMAPETKTKAKQKLDTLIVGVGYPDLWRNYSSLEIVKGDALGNQGRAEIFEYHRQLAKLNQPIDRGEWWITSQTVDALNLPLQNALNFPAAIIQPPFFDARADAAHNYGAMGAIIGHEISHSFDDQGSQFDAQGTLANWWTKADFEHFKAEGAALAAQFDAYRPFPDLAVNGQMTLTENIADVAGLLAAYDAYHLSLGGAADTVKDGFTGDQRFFISFAQTWRNKMRDAALRRQIATDSHAPAQYRADTQRNLDGFYSAFSVVPGQKLYLKPEHRVHVW